MADLIIKGMEMPTSCYYCPFMDGSWGYSPPHKARCVITGKDMPVVERGVQNNQACPLVPVPPHGRLIDADILYEKWIWGSTDRTADTKCIELIDLALAPTVIEESEVRK